MLAQTEQAPNESSPGPLRESFTSLEWLVIAIGAQDEALGRPSGRGPQRDLGRLRGQPGRLAGVLERSAAELGRSRGL